MTDETAHIATAAASLDDPHAALNQHLHGDGDWPGPGEKPHKYSPDPMMMGDCGVCGHTRSAHDTAWRTRALAAEAEVERLRVENDDLKSSVTAFCGPWAVKYARDSGLPDGHLMPTHYDILERAGARMDYFTRASLAEGGPDAR